MPDVELVFSSGWARAWETAVILHDIAGWPEPQDCPPLEADKPAASALDVLRGRQERSIALVGHEPYLSSLASILCAKSEDGMRLQLKKGAVAVIGIDGDVEPGAGYLLWAAAPRILRALDGGS